MQNDVDSGHEQNYSRSRRLEKNIIYLATSQLQEGMEARLRWFSSVVHNAYRKLLGWDMELRGSFTHHLDQFMPPVTQLPPIQVPLQVAAYFSTMAEWWKINHMLSRSDQP